MGNAAFADIQKLVPKDQILCRADLDGDGRADFIFKDEYEIYWRKNQGNAVFQEAEFLINVGYYFSGLRAWDVDGDGDYDITHEYGGDLAGMRSSENLGNMTFGPNHTMFSWSGENCFWQGLSITDADNDGDPDVFFGYDSGYYPGTQSYYYKIAVNDGEGSFTPITIFGGLDTPISFQPADIDGDGFKDYVTQTWWNKWTWIENDGTNHFTNCHDLIEGIDYMIFFDPDEDGDDDLLFSSITDSTFWRENIGNGSLADEVLLSEHTGILNHADVDADGDRDLVITSDSLVVWIENITTPMSVPEITNFHYSVSPNPARNFMDVLADFEIGHVSIFNTAGQLLFGSHKPHVDLTGLAEGFYFVSITELNGSCVGVEKLIIVR